MSGRLLDWAEQQRARATGRPFLRLDCSEPSDRLRRYYRNRGFSEVGRREPGAAWWPVTLFEEPVGN